MTRRPRRSGDLEWTEEMLDMLRGLLNTRYKWMMTDLDGHKLPMSNSLCWGELAAAMRAAFPGQGFRDGSKGNKQIRDKFRNTLGPGIDNACGGVWSREQWLPVLKTFPSMFKLHCSGAGKVGSLYQHVFQAIRELRPDGKSPSTEAIKNRMNKVIESYKEKTHEQVRSLPWYTPEMFETVKALGKLQKKTSGPRKQEAADIMMNSAQAAAASSVPDCCPMKIGGGVAASAKNKLNRQNVVLRFIPELSCNSTFSINKGECGQKDGSSTPTSQMSISTEVALSGSLATSQQELPSDEPATSQQACAALSRSGSGMNGEAVGYCTQQQAHRGYQDTSSLEFKQQMNNYNGIQQQSRQVVGENNMQPIMDELSTYPAWSCLELAQPLIADSISTLAHGTRVADNVVVARWCVNDISNTETALSDTIPMSDEEMSSLDMCDALKTPCKHEDGHLDLLADLNNGSLQAISCNSLFDWALTL